MELVIQAAIGLVAGLLGGLLGVGGSVIIIPALILYLSQTESGYAGTEQHLIQAAAMICNVFVAAPSVAAHWRAGVIMRPVVLALVPSAVAANFLGVHLSNTSVFARENGAYLAMIFAAFMLYVAGYNTWRLSQNADLAKEFDQSRKTSAWRTVVVGSAMGFAAGLLGIGGGALCVPMQQILLRIPLRWAIANSAVTIVFVAAVGAVHKNLTLPAHGVPAAASLQLALMLIPTAILGSYLGGKLTHALPRKGLRLVFIAFMLTMAYLTFTEAWKAAVTETLTKSCT